MARRAARVSGAHDPPGAAPGGKGLARFFPVLDWGRRYDAQSLSEDALAAAIVTIMLIPQSLAYALLAGLPPEAGLYASIAPLLAYAALGTSSALAVGPVAVISLMTAAAIGRSGGGADAALTLAALSGAMMLALGVLRLGALANLLSHPVVAGFITASALLIAASQIGALTGMSSAGDAAPEIVAAIADSLGAFNPYTALIGAGAIAFLFWTRKGLAPLLARAGLSKRAAGMTAKAGPILAVVATTLAVPLFGLAERGVARVGAIPSGPPPLAVPALDFDLVRALWLPALLISVIGFVESVSVAQTLAAKRRARIDPDQELIALGGANLAASVSGGFPVTGGFARSVVNFDAGARTPAAGAFTAIGLLIAALFFTPLLRDLPKATLGATIVVAVLSLVDLKAPLRIWRYSKADGAAMIATMAGTLFFGVEAGVTAGVASSLALHLKRTSTPHVAVVGQAPGTEHFRNIARHAVVTDPSVLSLRIDESLYFANARFLEDTIAALVAERPALRHVVLLCSAVNHVDASALESLEAINHRLHDAGVAFHLSEVKGPVMDRLKRSQFLDALTGAVFLTHFGAMSALASETTRGALAMTPDESLFLAERKR